MIGGGFVFALLPVLRNLFKEDEAELQEALQRHSEHFNAHPYLSNLALGAVCRMEEEGEDPEEIRRFKLAVKGPLGSLGDAVIWVGWRPATVLGALVLALAGATPAITVGFFLIAYNMGHLALRAWGFNAGLNRGKQVAVSIRAAGFPTLADNLAALGVFLMGGLVGLAFARGWDVLSWALVLLVAAGGIWGIWLGSLVGQKGWRWSFWAVAGAISIIFLVGWFG
jgi:mannose/fructose/N-acetylgalactosamine-specific phosphotransferase system component IID